MTRYNTLSNPQFSFKDFVDDQMPEILLYGIVTGVLVAIAFIAMAFQDARPFMILFSGVFVLAVSGLILKWWFEAWHRRQVTSAFIRSFAGLS